MGKNRFTTAQDGLRLHALEYGDRHSPLLPVVRADLRQGESSRRAPAR